MLRSYSLTPSALEYLDVTPSQVGFAGARLAARLETWVRRKGKWSRGVIYLLSSCTLAELQAQGMLALKRGYWVVESRLHHCLDITRQADQSRLPAGRQECAHPGPLGSWAPSGG